jgi:hypothetical protein
MARLARGLGVPELLGDRSARGARAWPGGRSPSLIDSPDPNALKNNIRLQLSSSAFGLGPSLNGRPAPGQPRRRAAAGRGRRGARAGCRLAIGGGVIQTRLIICCTENHQ